AFVNGFQIHCQEFDCVHERAVVHPMATILAALLAEAERRGPVSGEAFLAAVIVAVDVAAGLGVAARNPIRFFRPATAGLFGAALGIARLRGFDGETARDALGQALGHAAGVMQAHVEGRPTLPIQIGNAARAAHLACDLAEAGVPGPHDVLEGPYAYLPLFEGEWDLAPVLEGLGRVWRIAEVSHKPFPTGRAAHGGITLMQRLRADGVTPDAVERIVVTAPPLVPRLVGRPLTEPLPVNYARLCFSFVGAVALSTGTVALDDFSPERRADPALRALGAKIAVEADGSDDPAAFAPQTVRAHLAGGRVAEARIEAVYGSPADPMTREAALDKARACLRFGLGPQADADAILARLQKIDTEQDIAGLLAAASGDT
ncbi:MAG: MmgE/PrpD family protein, partial [Caulobacterales bacterium]|nr:MmgE/PrpD family protein [Caulobacterales bacterium]